MKLRVIERVDALMMAPVMTVSGQRVVFFWVCGLGAGFGAGVAAWGRSKLYTRLSMPRTSRSKSGFVEYAASATTRTLGVKLYPSAALPDQASDTVLIA
jgi:hypothetical protein